jgi:hypothetical protein
MQIDDQAQPEPAKSHNSQSFNDKFSKIETEYIDREDFLTSEVLCNPSPRWEKEMLLINGINETIK